MLGVLVLAALFGGIFLPLDQSEDFMAERNKMVEEQIIRRGIDDENVIKALRKVERHLFVPPNDRPLAYRDHPLPIGFNQTISQPYIVAYMSQAAHLKKDDKVLEIGTGSGYQAAVLAEIVREVYTIELIEGLAKSAQERLAELGYTNVFVRHGDGYQGWPEHAPYDVIIVTAAPETIPPKLIEQLKLDGRMVVPIGSVYQELYLITKTPTGVVQEALLPVRFVPMVPDNGENNL